MIGSLAFDRNSFFDVPLEQQDETKAKEKELSDQMGHWMATCIDRSSMGRKGHHNGEWTSLRISLVKGICLSTRSSG
jgi:hypothetical protein